MRYVRKWLQSKKLTMISEVHYYTVTIINYSRDQFLMYVPNLCYLLSGVTISDLYKPCGKAKMLLLHVPGVNQHVIAGEYHWH